MKRAVIIGLGSIAKRHASNLKKLYPDIKILAMSSSGKLQDSPIIDVDELATTINQVISFRPDFAIVASPATFHFQHAKELLKLNIPTLIEKPIAATRKDAKEMVVLANETKVPVSVAYCLRYLPAANIVKSILEENQLGPIYNVMAHVGQYLPDWRKDKDYRFSVSASLKLGGGALLELSHELDYLHWFLGELHLKYALLRNTNELNLDVEEIADVILSTDSGTICSVHLNLIQKKPQRYCNFVGEKGHLCWDLIENRVAIYTNEKENIIYHEPFWDRNTMYLLMLKDFMQKITSQNHCKRILSSAMHTVELIEKIKSQSNWGIKQ
ncbi:Gfo/Idh/MocA family protein [Legionella hackeliae]|uniref:Oxidoreductase n=1 Tax=Legionella hackeliae TaxID=449 RepID=A0A0A8UNB1_LEGHA|nr:Gfo/Idh/MocA family oxidoreductase [Legionella hackeliae]KTD08795.1 oxidoreductase [Legionella hackeliae]CEK10223.1 Oxidoreductase [Legionella hackeliae]STX46952.1 oxidoreductase [Legionella hackeliae]